MNGVDGHFNLMMLQRNMQFQNGVDKMNSGDYQGAQQIFKVILHNIQDLEAKFQLARCFQFSREYDQALITYEEVFKKNPQDPRPIYQQGQAAIQHYEKAMQILNKAPREFLNDPKFSIIYYQLGCKYEQINEIEKAKKIFLQFTQYNNLSEDYREKGLNKLKSLSMQQLDVSETQQYKQCSQEQNNNSKKDKNQAYEDEDKSKPKINIVKENEQQALLNQGKDELKNEAKKYGDSYINSQVSTAFPSINLIQVPIDDQNQKLIYQQQQEYRFFQQQCNNQPFFNSPKQHELSSMSQQQQPPAMIASTPSILKVRNSQNNQDQVRPELQLQRNQISFDKSTPKEIWVSEQINEVSNNVLYPSNQLCIFPTFDEGEASTNEVDADIPDEKDGKMMQNKTSFRNIHAIKNIPMKSFVDLSNGKKQIYRTISLSSQLSFSRHQMQQNESQGNQSYQKLKDFEHPEKTLNSYIIQKQLGEGSYGKVFEVIYKADGNSFALKVISNSSVLQQHLTSGEIDVMKSLNHKNIVKIYNAFKLEDQQSYCIISELADNGTLKEYIQKKRGNVEKYEVLNLMKQMITALNYIHSQRIIHRDIKPGNIFLHGNSKQIKIGDFGIAKKLTNKEVQQDMRNVGTEKYFSPEYRNEGFSEKSDIWSMGVQVYEELTDINKKQYFKQIPPEMSDIIAGMTQFYPQMRSTSQIVINQLKSIM